MTNNKKLCCTSSLKTKPDISCQQNLCLKLGIEKRITEIVSLTPYNEFFLLVKEWSYSTDYFFSRTMFYHIEILLHATAVGMFFV